MSVVWYKSAMLDDLLVKQVVRMHLDQVARDQYRLCDLFQLGWHLPLLEYLEQTLSQCDVDREGPDDLVVDLRVQRLEDPACLLLLFQSLVGGDVDEREQLALLVVESQILSFDDDSSLRGRLVGPLN